MKFKTFDYTKKDGQTSKRVVMILSETKEYVDAVDFQYLTEDEKEAVKKVQEEYEKKMKPYKDKAFRRFLKSGIIELKE